MFRELPKGLVRLTMKVARKSSVVLIVKREWCTAPVRLSSARSASTPRLRIDVGFYQKGERQMAVDAGSVLLASCTMRLGLTPTRRLSLSPNKAEVSRVDEDSGRLAEDEDRIATVEGIGEQR